MPVYGYQLSVEEHAPLDLVQPGELTTELALPRHFEQVAELLSPEDMADKLACGPDPEPVLEQAQEFEQAGFDHLYFHQVGPDQEGFFRFWREELKSRL